ncbi:hypothetical protein CHUAL_011054 [Chamberlinius hualienensis]
MTTLNIRVGLCGDLPSETLVMKITVGGGVWTLLLGLISIVGWPPGGGAGTYFSGVSFKRGNKRGVYD